MRELRNVLERATILVDGARDEELLPPSAPAAAGAQAQADPLVLPPAYLRMDYKAAKERLLEQFELSYFRRLLARHGANISGIAREAEVDRALVRKLLRRHKLI